MVFFQFTRIKMLSQTGTAFFTKEQSQWVELNKVLARLKPEVRPWVVGVSPGHAT